MKILASVLVSALLVPSLSRAATVNFDKGNVRAQVEFTKGPFSNPKKESMVQIQLLERKKGARQVDITKIPVVDVEMEMDSGKHGAGAPVVAVVSAEQHIFEAPIRFTMAGEWNIKITITYKDGEKESQTLPVDVP